MYRYIETFAVVIVFTVLFVIATATTIFFVQIEQETVSNQVAALLVERQQILNQVRLTPGIAKQYQSLVSAKPPKHHDYLDSIYGY